jgi:hypothetical protein
MSGPRHFRFRVTALARLGPACGIAPDDQQVALQRRLTIAMRDFHKRRPRVSGRLMLVRRESQTSDRAS